MKVWVLLALLLCVFTAGSNGIPLFRKFLEGLNVKANISNNNSTEEVKKYVSTLGDLISSSLKEIRGAVSPNYHHHLHRFHRHHLMRWNLRRTTPNPYRFSWDPEYPWGENATTGEFIPTKSWYKKYWWQRFTTEKSTEYPTDDWEEETEYPTDDWEEETEYPTEDWEEETEYPTDDWEEETEYPTEDWEEETEYPTEDWEEETEYPTEGWEEETEYPTEDWEKETEYPTDVWEEETEYPTDDWEEETEYPTEDWRETNRYEWRTTRSWWEGTKNWWNTYTTKAWWPMETTRSWWGTTKRWWQTRRPWWERRPTTKSWDVPTDYPWWWQRTTEAPWEPTEEWREPETTKSSHGRRWWKADWWRSIINPKHIKKGIQLFRDLDNDE